MLKPEARFLGIDDGPFEKKHKGKKVIVVGTIYRGGSFPDGVLSTKVIIDGNDATEKLIKMINQSKFKTQLKAVLLKGIALGGFNVINLKELSKKTGIPVLVVIRNYPEYERIFRGLKKLGKQKDIEMIKKLPKPKKHGDILLQPINMTFANAKEIIKITATRSNLPEPLRVAHLIAAGIVKGESRGRA